jgi:hypothetical protein
MGNDDRKLSYSERDRMRREGGGGHGGPPRGRRAEAEQAERTRDALVVADSLFAGEKVGSEGKALADAIRAAHGTPDLADACQAYLDAIGPPPTPELASVFLDAGVKELSIVVLDALLQKKASDELDLAGGLKRQIRILSEDFDDDLASRAEDLLD